MDLDRIADDGSSIDIDDFSLRSATEDYPATAMKKLSTSPATFSVSNRVTWFDVLLHTNVSHGSMYYYTPTY
jgi:hypothetical protein